MVLLKRTRAAVLIAVLSTLLVSTLTCGPTVQSEPPAPKAMTGHWKHKVARRYPHDPHAYTQGLIYHDGVLYESTGKEGESSVRRVDLATGEVLQLRANAEEEFAEGLTLWNGRLIQLTWLNKIVHFYDLQTLELLESRAYLREAWGLTHDGRNLIVSDGTPTLRFLDPQSLAIRREVEVHDGSRPVGMLNELEYIDGLVWANVYTSNRIAVIDPTDGAVRAWLDLPRLLQEGERAEAHEFNGIAYDPVGDRIFVTGKDWPWLFEIEVIGR